MPVLSDRDERLSTPEPANNGKGDLIARAIGVELTALPGPSKDTIPENQSFKTGRNSSAIDSGSGRTKNIDIYLHIRKSRSAIIVRVMAIIHMLH